LNDCFAYQPRCQGMRERELYDLTRSVETSTPTSNEIKVFFILFRPGLRGSLLVLFAHSNVPKYS